MDTNVPITANGRNEAATPACAAASASALQQVMETGHLFVDHDGAIVREYRIHLRAQGQPGPGDAFLKWVLTNEWGGIRITRVRITPKTAAGHDYMEVPSPPEGVRYDVSDHKFLAVSAAHEEHPPILQSLDTKWWGWRDALRQAGITVHFLCPDEVRRKHEQKTRR
jgi:hypothetical protein